MDKKKKYKNLISEIRDVLIKEWDPIGVGDNPNMNDEYDNYLGYIIELISKNDSVESIENFLKKIEKEDMEIETNDETVRKVAIELRELGNKFYGFRKSD